ncbi:MAG: hypothetical protein KVP17_003945 [Porospora cf. gigantea B]|uniref:uncharacterized protein n=2 Tax=Porospora cf. gigantea B TaxID=2853592 RepID=UPI0035719F29|nr:MAG: hypothetical protein KVP17_003945 [Porospora cf. gigantea B]
MAIILPTENRKIAMWTAANVRQTFIDYFSEKHNHSVVPSAPVVPHNDPSLLFVNAGMNQFKAIFTGQIEANHPLAKLKRAVDTQKCIRAGGKHNDLEDVGKDGYHHTFFEMLGNWSFGDFFKQEAIDMAWDLLVNVYKVDKERIYVTYYGGDPKYPNVPVDTVARDMWKAYLPEERIIGCDAKDNFWEMGDTGPCGPCSEIHFDRIGGRFVPELVNADDPMLVEVWNLVFMQYNKNAGGELAELPACCVDTGMGLERLTSVLQNFETNYHTDLFTGIFAAVQKACPLVAHPYTGKFGSDDVALVDTSYRVVADHIRTLTIAICDGAVPSNEGRGYVLRRILRRAVRFGRQYLNAPLAEPWLSSVVDGVVESLGAAFPELGGGKNTAMKIIAEEELSFARTLDKGCSLFNRAAAKVTAAGASVFPGEKAFELYASYGFPLDLTTLMAEENGLTVDQNEFDDCFQRHQKASESAKFKGEAAITLSADQIGHIQNVLAVPPTDDTAKYDWTPELASGPTIESTVMAIWDGSSWLESMPDESPVGLFVDKTNFYAESGGQVGDCGTVSFGEVDVDVVDTQRFGPFVMHLCKPAGSIAEGIVVGTKVEVTPNFATRLRLAQNHSGTHMLNFGLRQVLGADCDQKGSIVLPDKLRFDYSTDRVLTADEISRIEEIVRSEAQAGKPIQAKLMALDQAKQTPGVRALFGEQYPDPVRMVTMGDDGSVEFCGGTHLHNTSELVEFVVISDDAVARGIRRIVAVSGQDAKDCLANSAVFETTLQASESLTGVPLETGLNDLKLLLKEKKNSLSLIVKKRALSLIETLQARKLEEGKIRSRSRKQLAECLGRDIGSKCAEGGDKFVVTSQPELEADFKALETLCAEFSKKSQVPLLVVSKNASQASVLATSATDCLAANEWVSSVLTSVGGKGGGKKNQARGTTSDNTQLNKMVDLAEEFALSRM